MFSIRINNELKCPSNHCHT